MCNRTTYLMSGITLTISLVESLIFMADTKTLLQINPTLNKLYWRSWNEHLCDIMLYFFPMLFKEKCNLLSLVSPGLHRNTLSHNFKAILRFQSRTVSWVVYWIHFKTNRYFTVRWPFLSSNMCKSESFYKWPAHNPLQTVGTRTGYWLHKMIGNLIPWTQH